VTQVFFCLENVAAASAHLQSFLQSTPLVLYTSSLMTTANSSENRHVLYTTLRYLSWNSSCTNKHDAKQSSTT